MIRSRVVELRASIVGVAVTIGAADTVAAQSAKRAKPVVSRVGTVAARGAISSDDTARRIEVPVLAADAPSIGAAIHAAVTDYRSTGVARPVTLGTVVALPFGRVEPVVTCTILRACIVELEAGERLTDQPVAGDPVRWSIDSAKAGPGGSIPLVLVKPRACDITTNLVVPTDRRIYDLTLDSPACARGTRNPRQAGVRHVRFYYPDDTVTAALPARVAAGRSPSAVEATPSDPLDALLAQNASVRREANRAYRVVRQRRGPFGLFGRKPVDFPWVPASMADDGVRTYVALPVGAAPHAAPVLYAIEDDGSRTMVNFAVRAVGGTQVYVADRVVRRAALVLMAGSRERKLEIENRGWGRVPANADSASARRRGQEGG